MMENKTENPNLTTCPDCHKEVSIHAKVCPHCGREFKDEKAGNVRILVTVLGIALMVIAIILILGIPSCKSGTAFITF